MADTGDHVRITKSTYEGELGCVIGEDDKTGENIVELLNGEETIVPEDGLEVLS